MNRAFTLLPMLSVQLPTILACLAAIVVIIACWRPASRGYSWALAGFGLALLLSFVTPVVQTFLQAWVMESGERESRMWAFSTFSLATSLMRALVYVLLLLAILAARSQPAPPRHNP